MLGDISYDDLREMGVNELGPRRKIFREITSWRDEREVKKADTIRAQMLALEQQHYEKSALSDSSLSQRLGSIKAELGRSMSHLG